MTLIRKRAQEDRSTDLDIQAEITRLTFHNLAPTAFVGAIGVSGATAAAAYSFHDSWLWYLTGVMAVTGCIRTALPIAFNRRKNRILTPAKALRWQLAHAGMNALNCCNMAASTLYNFSHHGQSMQFICASGVFILCTGMAAGFGMKPWIAQGCGLIMLCSLAYPIVRSPDRLLAWDGSAMIVLFALVYCKLAANKYEMVVEQLRLKRIMSHLAEHDALTGLPNRRQFETRLAENCQQSTPFAVLFLDLDGFKKVNDVHGHATGDSLLQHVATRLRGAVQNSDIISRLGGDEFAILHQPLASRDSSEAMARRILETVSAPYTINGLQVQIGTSIGIQLSAPANNDPDRLLSQADAALYEVKKSGKGNFRFVESVEAIVLAGPRATSPDSSQYLPASNKEVRKRIGKVLVGIGD